MNDEMKYEEALAQLETIVRKMENNDYTIDELTEQLPFVFGDKAIKLVSVFFYVVVDIDFCGALAHQVLIALEGDHDEITDAAAIDDGRCRS